MGLLGWIFGGGLFMGIACSAIAYYKNRSLVGWFFLGLIFGPIALIILLFLKKLR